jgi:pimeloyl-ACP methyl ester carboxylesterase
MPRRSALISLSCSLLFIASSRLLAAEGYFDSNGVKIRYTVQGKGEPVVLIHGFTLNPFLQWDVWGITRELQKNYQVVTIDCRGHGRSGKPHDAKLYGKEMVDDVVRLLDHLKIHKAHIVGYSMGGFITLNMLARYPERMITATTGGAGWTDKVDTKFLNEVADSLANGKGMGPLLRRLTPKGQALPTDKELASTNMMTATINDMKALAAAIRALGDLAFAEEVLRKNQVPTLALVGAYDPLKEDVDVMAVRMNMLTECIIPNSDHMDAFAKPQFIKDLKEFLAKHPLPDNARPTGEAAPASQKPEAVRAFQILPEPAPAWRCSRLFRRHAWARNW